MKTTVSALVLTACLLCLPTALTFAASVDYAPVVSPKSSALMQKPEPATAKAEVKKTIEYQLPYPGILPNHPLYFLKQIRDTLLDRLIVDPLRKTEFYILQADKRLGMGLMLFDKGNESLGESVISKGEQYLNKTLMQLTDVKKSGREIPGAIMDRLERSIAKHLEVVEALLARADEAQQTGLNSSLALVKKLQEELGKLK